MKKGDHLKGEIEILASNLIVKNQYITVYNDDVVFPSGQKGTYFRLEAPSLENAGILPIREDGRFGLIKNYRHGVRGWCYEMIKGAVEQGEALLDAASRELKEEAGLSAEQFFVVGEYSDSPAIMSGTIHCFIAKGLHRVEMCKEATEAIEGLSFFNLEEYKAARRDMDFVDGLTELIVLKYIYEFE